MVTSKKKKAKTKRTTKSTSPRRKSVAAKSARKGASKAKTAAAAPTELHPRLREQALRSERSNFTDDFHALYDRGFRASRGIAPVTAAAARAGSRRLAAAVKGVEIHYDDATQLPNMVVTRQPAARLSRRSAGSAEGAVTEFIRSRADLWNLSDTDAETVEVVSLSQARSEGPSERRARRGKSAAKTAKATLNLENLKTVNMIQRVEGIEVFNSE